MTIKYENGKEFKQAVELLNEFRDTQPFEVNETGLHTQSMCDTKISLIKMHLPTPAFTEFEDVTPKRFEVNLKEWANVFKTLKKYDYIRLDADADKLYLGNYNGGSNREFKYQIDDADADCKIPSMPDRTNIIKVTAKHVLDAVEDAEKLECYHLTFNTGYTGDAGISFTGVYGNAGNPFKIEVKPEDVLSQEIREPAHAIYSTDFLKRFLRKLDKNTLLTLEYRTESILKMTVLIGDMQIEFYLAPRIEG